MDLGAEFAKQGLGWMVAVVEFGVIVYLGKLVISLQNKRVEDLQQSITSFISTSKDLLSGNQNLQKTMEKQTDLLEAALRK